MVIGALLQCTSYDLPQLIVGRIVTGFGKIGFFFVDMNMLLIME